MRTLQELNNLAKGYGMPAWQIEKIVNVAKIRQYKYHKRRIQHRWAKGGWTIKKEKPREKSMLSECIMGVGDYLLFKDRYFPDNCDDEMRIKLLQEFKKNHPEYRSRESNG